MPRPTDVRVLRTLIGCCAFLALTVGGCTGRPAAAPPPVTAAAVEQAVIANYRGRALQLYGRVTTTLGPTILITDFTASVTAQGYDLHWNRLSVVPEGDSGGSLELHHGVGSITMTVGTKVIATHRDQTPIMALAMATGVSSCSAPLVNAIWENGGQSLFPNQAAIAQQGGTCRLSGLDAHGGHVTLTIRDRRYITQVHQEIPAELSRSGVSKLAMDDATIRSSLAAAGMPATDETIRQFRSLMAQTQQQLSAQTDPMLIDTVLSEQPLPPQARPALPTQPLLPPNTSSAPRATGPAQPERLAAEGACRGVPR